MMSFHDFADIMIFRFRTQTQRFVDKHISKMCMHSKERVLYLFLTKYNSSTERKPVQDLERRDQAH